MNQFARCKTALIAVVAAGLFAAPASAQTRQHQSRHRRQPRLFRHGVHGPLHHQQLENRRRKNVRPVLLGPHRPPPDRTHDPPRLRTHRPHPPVQRLRLHHVLHHLRHQVLRLELHGLSLPLLRHLPAHRPRRLVRRHASTTTTTPSPTMYTLPDGKTIAGVDDIGKTMVRPGNRRQGSPRLHRPLSRPHRHQPRRLPAKAPTPNAPSSQIVHDFTPKFLKYRYYYYNQDRGHRYILNLRDGEVYTRYYSRQDVDTPNAVARRRQGRRTYKADPAYFVPNGKTRTANRIDPEAANPRYHIRGNGDAPGRPLLDDAHLPGELYSSTNVKAGDLGLAAADAQPARRSHLQGRRRQRHHLPQNPRRRPPPPMIRRHCRLHHQRPAVERSLEIRQGRRKHRRSQAHQRSQRLLRSPRQSHTLPPRPHHIKSISFDTITEINAHTQPQLNLGKNTVYVGNGEQTESIVFWPELRQRRIQSLCRRRTNIATAGGREPANDAEGKAKFRATPATSSRTRPAKKATSPSKSTPPPTSPRSPTAAACTTATKSHIDFLHSFDGGKTWKRTLLLHRYQSPLGHDSLRHRHRHSRRHAQRPLQILPRTATANEAPAAAPSTPSHGSRSQTRRPQLADARWKSPSTGRNARRITPPSNAPTPSSSKNSPSPTPSTSAATISPSSIR